ncbi:hypothetical protein M3661_07645 [Paenibacillus sp. MER 180]|uniref:hypothetical protein n=1 Tax=Paenibacillus sp. MER 180 TaxID=2939570 RepID=UPI00203F55AA|nr:hypothetical protein [Paenibacillus sp. MER 180]MCM3289998.1 hypothetical protein [Paenibacillus sp. MER 180]
MDFEKHKQEIIQLSESLGLKLDYLKGVDCFFPFFTKIEEDSSVIIIKLDGEREENKYTLLILGKMLGQGEYIRAETSDLEGGLSFIIVEYAKRTWNWSP